MAKEPIKKTIAKLFPKSQAAISRIPGIETQTLAEGESLSFGSGSRACVYLVAEGYLSQIRTVGRKHEEILRLVGPRSTCGFEAFLMKGTAADRYEAVVSATVVRIPKLTLEKLALSKGGEPVLREVAEIVAAYGEELLLRGCFLTGNNGSESIRRVLKYFGWGENPPIKWKTIATYFGMNICAFSRSLTRLRRNGSL